MVIEELYYKALEIRDMMADWRQSIHAHPEVGLKEYQTSSLVNRILSGLEIETRTGLSETGVVGLIKGFGKKTIALRADMDALPIEEKTGLPYKSCISGLMHACGHDGHTAMLLGASILLKGLSSRLKGNVKLVFQPAEEQSLIGKGGARQMVAEGVLNSPYVSSIVGLHLDPELPLGSVGIRAGPLMSSSTTFEVCINGRESHASAPHQGVDAIYLASYIILACQGIAARETSALNSKVITIGEIHGGVSPNILASQVKLRGTIRTLSSEVTDRVQCLVRDRSRSLAMAFGGSANSSFHVLYPPLINDPYLASVAQQICAEHPGVERVEEIPSPLLAGEDFAHFTEKIPGFMFRLGCRKHGLEAPLHSPLFDFDEQALPIGASLLAAMAYKLLE